MCFSVAPYWLTLIPESEIGGTRFPASQTDAASKQFKFWRHFLRLDRNEWIPLFSYISIVPSLTLCLEGERKQNCVFVYFVIKFVFYWKMNHVNNWKVVSKENNTFLAVSKKRVEYWKWIM